MKANQTAATAAAFGAEGVDRGKMVQEWSFYCWCGLYRSPAVHHDVARATEIARMAGWQIGRAHV